MKNTNHKCVVLVKQLHSFKGTVWMWGWNETVSTRNLILIFALPKQDLVSANPFRAVLTGTHSLNPVLHGFTFTHWNIRFFLLIITSSDLGWGSWCFTISCFTLLYIHTDTSIISTSWRCHSVFIFEHKPVTSNVALATKEQNGPCLTWEIIS